MAKIYLDEINAALGFSTFDTLEKDTSDSSRLDKALDSYVSDSGTKTKLAGDAWDQTRTKMGTYKDALATRASVAGTLSTAIKEALNLLKDYLGTDEMLDTEKLPEMKEQKKACEDAISNLEAMLKETKVNDEGKTVHVYNTDEVNAQLTLAKETLKEIDRLIEKIEGLDEVYNKAVAILDAAYESVLAFGKQVGAIKPSGKFEYKKKNG